MSDMGLVVVGAAGRMGQQLIRTIHTMDGVRVAGAIERAGSPHLGKDAGEIAGRRHHRRADHRRSAAGLRQGRRRARLHACRRRPSSSPAMPRRRASCMSSAPPAARPEDDARIAAAARHATIVKSGNMSLGVNLLAVLVEQAAQGARPATISTSRSSRCTTATRSTRRPARRCCSARRRPPGAASRLPKTASGARRPHRRAPGRRDRLRHAARRLGGRRAFRLPCRHRRAHHAVAPCRGPRHLRARRGQGGTVGARQEARPLFDARRARPGHDRPARSLINSCRSKHVGNSRPRPPRPERMEPEEPVHRLARCRPDRAGPRRGQGRRRASSRRAA